MRKITRKILGPLAVLAMALGVGLSVAKTPTAVKAATETYTYNTGDGTWVTTNSVRTYDTGNFTMTHRKNSGSNIQTGYAELRLYASHSLEIVPTVAGKTIKKVAITVSETKYVSPMDSATVEAGPDAANAVVVTGISSISGLVVTFDFQSFSNNQFVKFTMGAQARTTTYEITYDTAVQSVITSLTLNKSTLTYFTTDTLEETDFTVSLTKDGTPIPVGSTSDYNYTVKIGAIDAGTFTGVDVVWGTTQPTTAHTTIRVQALHPTTQGGSTYLHEDITLTVNTPTLQSIAISGTMTRKNYKTTGVWDPTGLVVTATYDNSAQVDVTSQAVFSYNPPKPNSTTITSVAVTATWSGKTDTYNQTGIVVSQKVNTIMISEAYGGGGNSGALYKNDFVELYNATNNNIDLAAGGYVLYFTSASGNFSTDPSNQLQLTGTILAKSYFLIQHQAGSGGTQDLPTPDQIGAFAIGASAFKLALTNSTTAPAGSSDASVIDFLGAGNCDDFEVAKAPTPSNTNSVSRKLDVNGEPVDTDNNSEDFVAGAPIPKNSALSVAGYIMESNTVDQCITKYPVAKARIVAMSLDQLNHFKTKTDTADAKERYEAWAIYHGDATPYSSGGAPRPGYVENQGNTIAAAVAIGVIGLTAMFGYYFLTKKKRLA